MCSQEVCNVKHALLNVDVTVYFVFSFSCATLWTSFQHKKERLVDQLVDIESKMAAVTTAKAVGLQHAEEKVQRCKVSCGLLKFPSLIYLFNLFTR